ncbi:GNAT family N-acetyltransferase [Candidatus Pacearchaeota archaeon]|nr:GNAT family N-acetyltransferase [Candidatus Pacearchaeota archaeon]
MRIRKAAKKDFREIAKILMEESSKKPYNEKYSMKIAIKEIVALSQDELYVAVNEKEIMGFIASNITPDNKKKAYIRELWLRPIYQGKGSGKALVEFIEKMYKKKGVNIVRLVAKKNAGAFKFYKEIKYKEYREMVFMEKRLK